MSSSAYIMSDYFLGSCAHSDSRTIITLLRILGLPHSPLSTRNPFELTTEGTLSLHNSSGILLQCLVNALVRDDSSDISAVIGGERKDTIALTIVVESSQAAGCIHNEYLTRNIQILRRRTEPPARELPILAYTFNRMSKFRGISSQDHHGNVIKLLQDNHAASTVTECIETRERLFQYVIITSAKIGKKRFEYGLDSNGKNYSRYLTRGPEFIPKSADDACTDSLRDDVMHPVDDRYQWWSRLWMAANPRQRSDGDRRIVMYDAQGRRQFQRVLRCVFSKAHESIEHLSSVIDSFYAPNRRAGTKALLLKTVEALEDLDRIRTLFPEIFHNHLDWLSVIFFLDKARTAQPDTQACVQRYSDDQLLGLEEFERNTVSWAHRVEAYLEVVCMHIHSLRRLEASQGEKTKKQQRISEMIRKIQVRTIGAAPLDGCKLGMTPFHKYLDYHLYSHSHKLEEEVETALLSHILDCASKESDGYVSKGSTCSTSILLTLYLIAQEREQVESADMDNSVDGDLLLPFNNNDKMILATANRLCPACRLLLQEAAREYGDPPLWGTPRRHTTIVPAPYACSQDWRNVALPGFVPLDYGVEVVCEAEEVLEKRLRALVKLLRAKTVMQAQERQVEVSDRGESPPKRKKIVLRFVE